MVRSVRLDLLPSAQVISERQAAPSDEREALERALEETRRAVAALEDQRVAAEESVRSVTAAGRARLTAANAQLEASIAALEAARRATNERARQFRANRLAAAVARAGLAFGWTLGAAAGPMLWLSGHQGTAALTVLALLVTSLRRR